MEEKYIVALEVGSSKIRGALGVVDRSGILTLKAVEEERLIDSVRYGCVRNVAEVASAVSRILQKLEHREGGRRVTGVYVGLGGRSTMASTLRVEHRLPSEGEITREHLRLMFDEARGTVLNDRDVVEVTPRDYYIDNSRVNNPVGTFGREIDATINLISCRSQLRHNLNHVLVNNLGLDVHAYVVRQLALANLVLTTDEKRLGVMLVDFGAETTTVSIYREGRLVYLATLPLGSRNITLDITSLNHLEEKAEKLKIAGADASLNPGNRVSGAGIDYTEINNLTSARAGEIIANIAEQIKLALLTPRDLPEGIVVTGGGAKLRGFLERLGAATKLKVRTGVPTSSVRITESGVQMADAVDVIALLHAAATEAKQCLEEAEETPEQNHIEPEIETIGSKSRHHHPEPEITVDPIDDSVLIDDDPPRKSGSKFFEKVKTRISRILSENEEDENDDLVDDDNNLR